MRANAADRQRRYRERKAAELKISHRNKFVIRSIINVRQWKGALQYEIVWRSISPGLSDRTGWYDVSTALNTDEKAAADRLIKQSDDLVEKWLTVRLVILGERQPASVDFTAECADDGSADDSDGDVVVCFSLRPLRPAVAGRMV